MNARCMNGMSINIKNRDSPSILCIFIVRWCWVDRHLGMDISIQKPFWFCWTIWVYLGHLRDMETGKMKFIKVSKSFGSFWRCFWYVSFPRIIHCNGIFHYKPFGGSPFMETPKKRVQTPRVPRFPFTIIQCDSNTSKTCGSWKINKYHLFHHQTTVPRGGIFLCPGGIMQIWSLLLSAV